MSGGYWQASGSSEWSAADWDAYYKRREEEKESGQSWGQAKEPIFGSEGWTKEPVRKSSGYNVTNNSKNINTYHRTDEPTWDTSVDSAASKSKIKSPSHSNSNDPKDQRDDGIHEQSNNHWQEARAIYEYGECPEYKSVKNLPAYKLRDGILAEENSAGQQNFVQVVHGGTGCGKSTCIPLILYENAQKKGKDCRIAITQPRRMAAINLSSYMHRVINRVGAVGHRVKLSHQDRNYESNIVYFTAGYLYQQLLNQPEKLGTYTHIILDEVHERTCEMDKLLLLLKELMIRKFCSDDLQLFVMSATMEDNLFVEYFRGINPRGILPTVRKIPAVKRFEVANYFLDDFVMANYLENDLKKSSRADGSGKIKINDRYMEFDSKHSKKLLKIADSMSKKWTQNNIDAPADVNMGLKDLLLWCIEHMADCGETVLVFLPGVQEITTMQEHLCDHGSPSGKVLNVIPLHRLIPLWEQKLASRDADYNSTNVILATNVAESSVTLGEKLTLIIDFCLQKRNTYSYERRVESLGTGWASQAASTQRGGRTGRTCAGNVVRFVTKKMFESLPAFDAPEVKMTNLDSLFLQVRELNTSVFAGLNISLGEMQSDTLGSISRQGKASKTVKELLQNMPSPLNDTQINDAIAGLFAKGALQRNSATSELTFSGVIATELGFSDVSLARMLFNGIVFNCAPDAILMVAVLNETGMQPGNIFHIPGAVKLDNCPHHMSFHDWKCQQQARWFRRNNRLIDIRRQFDNESYSEVIMARNVFKCFLEFLVKFHSENPYVFDAEIDDQPGAVFQEEDTLRYIWKISIRYFDRSLKKKSANPQIYEEEELLRKTMYENETDKFVQNAIKNRFLFEDVVFQMNTFLRILDNVLTICEYFQGCLPEDSEAKIGVDNLLTMLKGCENDDQYSNKNDEAKQTADEIKGQKDIVESSIISDGEDEVKSVSNAGDFVNPVFESPQILKVLVQATFHENLAFGRAMDMSWIMQGEDRNRVTKQEMVLLAFKGNNSDEIEKRLRGKFWNRSIAWCDMPYPRNHPALDKVKEGATNAPQSCSNPYDFVHYLVGNATQDCNPNTRDDELVNMAFKLEFCDLTKKPMGLVQFSKDKVKDSYKPVEGLGCPHRGCVSLYSVTNGRYQSLFFSENERDAIRMKKPILPFLLNWRVNIPPSQREKAEREKKMEQNALKQLHNQVAPASKFLSATLDHLSPCGVLCDFPSLGSLMRGEPPRRYLAIGGRVQITGQQARLSASTVLSAGSKGIKTFLAMHPLRGGLSIFIDSRNLVTKIFLHREYRSSKTTNSADDDYYKKGGIMLPLDNYYPLSVDDFLQIDGIRKMMCVAGFNIIPSENNNKNLSNDDPQKLPQHVLKLSFEIQKAVSELQTEVRDRIAPKFELCEKDERSGWYKLLERHNKPHQFIAAVKIREIFARKISGAKKPDGYESDDSAGYESDDSDGNNHSNETRKCPRCKELKYKEDFSVLQWKRCVAGVSVCLDCDAAGPAPVLEGRLCNSCNERKPPSEFSNSQMKRKADERICKSCQSEGKKAINQNSNNNVVTSSSKSAVKNIDLNNNNTNPISKTVFSPPPVRTAPSSPSVSDADADDRRQELLEKIREYDVPDSNLNQNDGKKQLKEKDSDSSVLNVKSLRSPCPKKTPVLSSPNSAMKSFRIATHNIIEKEIPKENADNKNNNDCSFIPDAIEYLPRVQVDALEARCFSDVSDDTQGSGERDGWDGWDEWYKSPDPKIIEKEAGWRDDGCDSDGIRRGDYCGVDEYLFAKEMRRDEIEREEKKKRQAEKLEKIEMEKAKEAEIKTKKPRRKAPNLPPDLLPKSVASNSKMPRRKAPNMPPELLLRAMAIAPAGQKVEEAVEKKMGAAIGSAGSAADHQRRNSSRQVPTPRAANQRSPRQHELPRRAAFQKK